MTPTGSRSSAPFDRSRVWALLDLGASYDAAASELGVPAGLVYLVATGCCADMSDALDESEYARPGVLASAQSLVNPPTVTVDDGPQVRAYIAARLEADASISRDVGEAVARIAGERADDEEIGPECGDELDERCVATTRDANETEVR